MTITPVPQIHQLTLRSLGNWFPPSCSHPEPVSLLLVLFEFTTDSNINSTQFRIWDGQCGTTRHFDPIGAVRYGDHRRRANSTPRTLDPHRQSGTLQVAVRSCRLVAGGGDIQGAK
ncbi:hypothetical protein B0H14DRAFT_2565344 [Mycena olivaceomarginata]|nr:hypothetical protein B0H14DRAFT_2565344 [Mycena olivaceomarginata]